MESIRWGMIGAGDVTEVKSGPAFNKVRNSTLVAVMRRDAAKAADYARRHNIPRWYSSADQLLADPEVNAVYIATPPDSHEPYALAAIRVGKAVYVEKPMTLDANAAKLLAKAADDAGVKLCVAHYRRAQPYFQKLRELLNQKAIGEPRSVLLRYWRKPLSEQALQDPKIQWRVNPQISGGGLFHDIAPHQLDMLYYLFGKARDAVGYSVNQSASYAACDAVIGMLRFDNQLLFSGSWNFNVDREEDSCEIVGSGGKIRFSFFSGTPIELETAEGTVVFSFPALEHVQQPMIEAVVQYFRNEGENPCSGWDGAAVMEIMDAFTK